MLLKCTATAPARQSREQSINGRLQHGRVIAKSRRLAEGLVDHRVERDDSPGEFPSHRLSVGEIGSGHRQRAGEPVADFGRESGEQRRQSPPRATKIGTGENDAGADDADADLAGAEDRKHEGFAVRAAGRAELVARDDRRRIAGQRRRVSREVAQHRTGESTCGTPHRQPDEKRRAVLRKAGCQHDDRDSTH
jgi:hypothetical protein